LCYLFDFSLICDKLSASLRWVGAVMQGMFLSKVAVGLVALIVALPLRYGLAADLALSGSTTVQSRILEPLAEDIKKATGITIKVEGIGSGNGFKRLLAGEVPVAIVSAPLANILKSAGLPDDGTYRQHDVLEDLIVPIVHVSNPVKELSWAQLTGLYSGSIKNWKEVGGPDLPVRVIISHPESATREVVWELVMGKKVDYARNARVVYATKKEMVMVAEYAGAIGAVSKGFVDLYLADVKTDKDEPEIKTIETQRISRPLALVTKGEPSPDVAKLLTFLRSEDAKKKFK
jgi:phosphate transport system substrate-binding protein